MTSRLCVVLAAALAISAVTVRDAVTAEPWTTTYGEKNPEAPAELNLFSFLVGKWSGTGRTRLADGSDVQSGDITWIGRYVLDGMAIADEIHSEAPDGKPAFGITIRHFDTKHRSWVIEFLNVSNSFLRRQVNPQLGALTLDAGAVVIISEDAQTRIRENYRVVDQSHFTYSMDTSRDGGRSWDPVLFEMTMTRVD